MKKLLSLVLSLTIVAAMSLTLVACSGNSDGSSNADTGFNCSVVQDKTAGDGYLGFATVKKYVLTEEQSKAVSKGNYSEMLDIVVPEEYVTKKGKYKINAVAEAAFANQLLFKSVKFGANVQTIGAGCLAGCANLSSITLEFTGSSKDALNEKKTLGYLFGTSEADGCVSTTVYYNGGDSANSATYYVPSALKTVTLTGSEISEYAFSGLNVVNIVLSGEVETIPEGAFSNMPKIAEITLPATVKTISKAAFKNDGALINVNFAGLNNLETVGDEAFYGCAKLAFGKNVVFGSAVKSIGEKAFYECVNLKGADLSATKITKVADLAFYGNSSLEEVSLPAGVEFGIGAFKSCDKLTVENVLVGGAQISGNETGYNAAFDERFYVA